MTLPRIQSLVRQRRVQVLAIVLLVPFLAIAPLHLFMPAPVKAHGVAAPVQVGTSFSPMRAGSLGLDYRGAFKRLEALHFRVIRLSSYWDQVDKEGYDQLDWLMNEAQRARQPIVLTVGMKALGWPEFFVPASVTDLTSLQQGQDVAADPSLRAAALAFIEDTVRRYRDNPALVAWQIENEPLNRAGPQRLWIDAAFLRDEISSVRQLDRHHRPLIVNAFSHFNFVFDQASARQGFDLRQWLGFDADSAERDSLAVLDRGDVLGLDVYTAIGYQFLGQDHLSRADADWPDRLARVRDLAKRQGKQAWITEAQAEPWESEQATYTDPKSTSPGAIRNVFENLKDAGYSTVLFWGSEYWLWRADNGDSRWIDAIKAILQNESRAPSMSMTL
ncbi:MAG: hypothetical protein E6I99_05485 [Chloroflexi bacterium]|nr:MAG: hypothetical protein E6I99_05485 [Chloroflexota bacterium]TMD82636.1 MAG: hypothetical protein E6I74_08110 [Chloroflexota bacterium]